MSETIRGDKMTFGKVLRQLRKEFGLTQKSLSQHLGIAESTIGMYEREQREPDFETLEAIADYFNVDMDYLTGRSNIRKSGNFHTLPNLGYATSWLSEKNKETTKQVAKVLAEAKATCSDVRAILSAVWDYLEVTAAEDADDDAGGGTPSLPGTGREGVPEEPGTGPVRQGAAGSDPVHQGSSRSLSLRWIPLKTT